MKILKLALGILAYSSFAFGTTIMPVPLSRLVNDADAVVEGTYKGSVTRVLATGEIVTEVSLELKRYAGLNANDLYNTEGFKVYFPGGAHNNRIVKVQSAPSFKAREHVMLFLEKKNFGYLIQNLSLGKFNHHKKAGGKDYYVSSLFPHHSELGQVSVDKLENLIEKRFSRKFVVLNEDTQYGVKKNGGVVAQTENKSRLPSSIDKDSNSLSGSSSASVFSIVGLFVVLLFTSFYIRRKKRLK